MKIEKGLKYEHGLISSKHKEVRKALLEVDFGEWLKVSEIENEKDFNSVIHACRNLGAKEGFSVSTHKKNENNLLSVRIMKKNKKDRS